MTVRGGDLDAVTVLQGHDAVKKRLAELRGNPNERKVLTAKEKDQFTALQVVNEMMARGVELLPVDIYKSRASVYFIEDGKIRMPFSSIDGIGENAAIKIKEARDSNEIHSVEDFQQKTMLSKAVIETLETNHVFDNLAKTNQLSIFDLL